MAWNEWNQVKAAAVARQSARTELNGAPSAPGDPGTLVSDRPAWSRAGHGVGALRTDLAKGLGQLADGQEGLGPGEDAGCLTAAAQQDVYGSWEKYLRKVSGRCGKLADVLERAGRDELRTEEAIKAEIARMKAAYADTPADGRGK
ncbi:hypothetical protein ACFPC0_02735 [Streptomyces andamanensis]|uniref:Excreted virulence factor EspC, type VII ESX diderm n=1 Tax=Streptomyces andamanensis TaxID=1565035 RepID=A0ABV8T704_9ACTN